MSNEKLQFTIESVVTKNTLRGTRIDVSVSYPGGAKIFDFPGHYGHALIVSQVRNALRTELAAAATAPVDKYAALIGTKYDL